MASLPDVSPFALRSVCVCVVVPTWVYPTAVGRGVDFVRKDSEEHPDPAWHETVATGQKAVVLSKVGGV